MPAAGPSASDTVVGYPPDGGRQVRRGADVRGAQPCRVRGVVVGHPLRLPFGVDPGGVVRDLAGGPLLVPAQLARHEGGHLRRGVDATVAVWMLTRAAGEHVVEVQRTLGPDRVHDLRGQVRRRPVQGGRARGRRGQGEDRADLVAVAAQQPGDGLLGQSAAAASSAADPRTSAQRCAPTSGRCAVREAGTAGNGHGGVDGVLGHHPVGRVLAAGDEDEPGTGVTTACSREPARLVGLPASNGRRPA